MPERRFKPRAMMEKAIEVMLQSVAESRDRNRDNVSRFRRVQGPNLRIPTDFPTKCRDSTGDGPPSDE